MPRAPPSQSPQKLLIFPLLMTMPRAPSADARRVRNRAMRSDRARGLSIRKLAAWYALAPSEVHRLVRDVQIQLPGPWHRARMPREAPVPYSWALHTLLSKKP